MLKPKSIVSGAELIAFSPKSIICQTKAIVSKTKTVISDAHSIICVTNRIGIEMTKAIEHGNSGSDPNFLGLQKIGSDPEFPCSIVICHFGPIAQLVRAPGS